VPKFISLLIIFCFLNNCSLDTKTGFWTQSDILEEEKENLEEIFKSKNILDQEFNPNLKVKINSTFTQKPFINNLSNNSGYINFDGNLKKISKFKFKKIKNFNFINPDLLIGADNSLVFFDEKGSIIKFNENSKLIWKENHYDKKQIKQNPYLHFATNDKILVVSDSIANLYAIDYLTGKLIWKNFNKSAFNSEIKIIGDKILLIDLENVIKCISIKNGKELWNFGTEKSFIKSQRKLSLIIDKEKVIFINTFGDISALDLNSGSLIWQSQTINEDIYENAFLLKSSKLVYHNETIYISNNQNKFFAIDTRNGFIKWEQNINSYLPPSIIENLILTVSKEGYFFILDRINGNILRSTSTLGNKINPDIYPTGFIVAKNFIYISLSSGKLLKVSILDGKTKDILKIDKNKISSPYVLNKQMYVLRNNAIIKIE
tara:strand:+ start:430 stop:1725 length:1296 start_codon:yes stop_codon:yes gene_type:complete